MIDQFERYVMCWIVYHEAYRKVTTIERSFEGDLAGRKAQRSYMDYINLRVPDNDVWTAANMTARDRMRI